MPKNRKVVKIDGYIRRFNMPRKMRIGNRKSGVTAYTMATDALKAVLENADQSKYHQNARTALASRGLAA